MRVSSNDKDGHERDLSDMIGEFSAKIQDAIRGSEENIVVVPGFPGFIEGKGTIHETGMGYSDFNAVMGTPKNGFLVLLKQSGAILQTNPNILPPGIAVNKIRIMPIRQAVRMTAIIGDQIQVIHPMALEEAQKNNVTIMVVDEKNPFSGGTLIVPNDQFDEYKGHLETLPMMGMAEDAYELTVSFHVPAGKTREDAALNALREEISRTGGKIAAESVINDDEGHRTIQLIVTGVADVSKFIDVKITDVKKINAGKKSFVIGISGLPLADFGRLKASIAAIFTDAQIFHEQKSSKLFSLGVIVSESDSANREEKLKQIMDALNAR